ncbi:twin-arginine translocation signal domain-containing protein [Halorussus ruber]|uniref:twin-arginine translocation signal domain-containing protein n=1 Tax=Halorussus ruber TaxID=1126238 RepID=UPI001092A816|nr:twin-arginine translocation signal domain-containing protein [Halorussus ruber]
MDGNPSKNDIFDLKGQSGGQSRRRFLKALGMAGAGTAGLVNAIERAYGERPDGVPVVYTDDVYGNPERVRFVPKERHRRLMVYRNLPIQKFVDEYPKLNGVTLTQRSSDETDLALKFLLDSNTATVRRKLPNRFKQMPIEYEEQPREKRPQSLEGGVNIGVEGSDAEGTVTVVAYDADTSENVVITADHVTEGASQITYVGDSAADLAHRDTATDTTSYTVHSDTESDPLATVNGIPDVTGAWHFAGLSDAVSSDTVPVQLFGLGSGEVHDECTSTTRSSQVEYQADMSSHSTVDGDSGGPWVDDDGKLLACHFGYDISLTLNKWSVGSVGRESLDAVNAMLAPMCVANSTSSC